MADRLILPPPPVAVGQSMGFIVLTWNGNQWQDDWDGEVHTDAEKGRQAFYACRAAGCDAVLVWCVAERPPEPPDDAARQRADTTEGDGFDG